MERLLVAPSKRDNASPGVKGGIRVSKRVTILVVLYSLSTWSPAQVGLLPQTLFVDPGSPRWQPAIPGPVVACFADDTDPAYAAFIDSLVEKANARNNAPRYQTSDGDAWGPPGQPIVLTWSFVPDGVMIPSAFGEPAVSSQLFATLDAQFASQGGRATWKQRFQQVFDRWSSLTGVTYQFVSVPGQDWDDGAPFGDDGAPQRGDVRISMKPIDGGSGILAYNYFPTFGDMVIDASENWAGGEGTQNRFLRNVIGHEHGHGLGLGHVCPTNRTKLMEPFLSTQFDSMQHDDIRAVQYKYGDPHEPDGIAAPVEFGTLGVGDTASACDLPPPISGANPGLTSLCAIEGSGAEDYFHFSTSAAARVLVYVVPLGFSYLDNPQTDICGGDVTTDSLRVADLVAELYAANGATLLSSVNAGGLGTGETLNYLAESPGSFYVRVFAANAPLQSQEYSLTVTLQEPGQAPYVFTQPQNQQAASCGIAVLSLFAIGTEPLTYQWRRGGVELPGETTPVLVVNPITLDEAGGYDCVVSNAYGSIASNPAIVTVTPTKSCPSVLAGCEYDDVYPVGGDCTVDLGDLGVALANFAPGVGGKTLDQGDVYPRCDGDGIVDLSDLGEILAVFGTDCR